MAKTIFYIVCGILTFMTSIGIMSGSIQKTIYFADPINEMITCVFLLMISFAFIIIAMPIKTKD